MKAENKPRTNVTASTILTHPCFYTAGTWIGRECFEIASSVRDNGFVGPPGPGTTKRGLRSRAHTACAGFRSADSTRRVFLLLLSGAVSCCCCCSCCLSRRCCSRSARAAEILAAHRCSHLLSRSSGILLTTKAPGSRSPPGQRPQRARAFKVQSEGIKLFLQSRGLRAGAP